MHPRLKSFFTVLLILVVIGLIYFAAVRKDQAASENSSTPEQSQVTPGEGLRLSETGRAYNSEALGISFTYDSRPWESFEVRVTEEGNKIYLHGTNEERGEGKIIEVLSKHPSQSLAEAIEEQFLGNVSRESCFVEEIPQDPQDSRPDNYEFAIISYPPATTEGAPFWEHRDKCHDVYSKINDVRYFMYNPDVPDKFVFVILGQDSITSDGVEKGEIQNREDWSGSIRIVD